MPAEFDTLQLHAGQERSDPATRARAVPIYATCSYTFESFAEAEAIFADKLAGNRYGRMHNPTVAAFTRRLVALEAGKAGLAFSSGQAASTATLLTLAKPGAHLLLSSELFGGTFGLVSKLLVPWGCRVSAVPPTPEAIRAAIEDDTVAVWCETLANPSGTVPDISTIAEVCKEAQVPFVVDNTFGCGGYLCQPLKLGADIALHSATKWIGGHGTFVAGAVIEAGRYDWGNGKFPVFSKLDSRGRSYLSRGGETAFTTRAGDLGLSTMGMTLSPFAAFLGLQGLETLSLRVQRACDTALTLAKWLETQPQVKRVIYPGLPSHPSHAVAERTLRHGFGAVLCFEAVNLDTAKRFLGGLQLASHLANIGDAKTVVINPWTTTHAGLTEEGKRDAGVTPELIRVSVGLEALADIEADFAQALQGKSPAEIPLAEAR
jgi:O-acetylhomoserine/O-acetylserine sulfhydrylase-like pyridoxal-dependent enzyme